MASFSTKSYKIRQTAVFFLTLGSSPPPPLSKILVARLPTDLHSILSYNVIAQNFISRTPMVRKSSVSRIEFMTLRLQMSRTR